MKRYRWKLLMPEEQMVSHLSGVINVSTPLSRALCNRGIATYDDAKDFFRPSIQQLPSPFLFKDMRRAVERVATALEKRENIMLYGDYDVDGTTGTALLYLFLQERGADVSYYINDRFTEGYGLSREGIETAVTRKTGLIITVDCGIRAEEQIRLCNDYGIDVIICDHHEPHELPPAYAILNPKRYDCTYPFRELCGCGVAFRFIQAIAEELDTGLESWQKYFDLVAIATAADMVVLEKENRTFVREGLKRIRTGPRSSLAQMLGIMNVDAGMMSMFTIAFGIAPRINAAGRMESATLAVQWLLSDSAEDSQYHAGELEQLNALRRKIDAEIFNQAEKMIAGHFASYCSSIVLYDEEWHLGVLGIVASKMLEKYYLPTVIMGNMNGLVKGSVRSVDGLNIYEVLQECSEYLEQFGGHNQAAGITLKPENLAGFRKRFDEICRDLQPAELRQKELLIDSPLALEDVTEKFMKLLEEFAPYGYGNREPLFVSDQLLLQGRPRLLKDRHVKFSVRDKHDRVFDVIGFDRRDIYEDLAASSNPVVAMVYSLEKRSWNNREHWQIRLRDLSITQDQPWLE
ncbi:MAG: single-stranded-DNA-specific exonuclease RecJ [Chlorobiaceae bacterium]|nr:single-stranded-DNA-specific exonuclease RecJ [Chlorobiaceae bacterium]